MAEYRIRFTADTSAAGRSISDIQKAIKAVTKEFEKAEIGAEDFADSASNLSKLKKELNDARSAVVNVDKAYQSLNKAIDANFAVAAKAGKAAEDYNKKLLNLAEEQLKAEDQARRKNFQAEVDDWDKRFNLAVAQSKKIAAKQRAIMEFRAGMGARGAIPAVASPIRGTAQMQGSPAYYEAINKAAKEAQINAEKAQQALGKASSQAAGIAPPPQAFSPYSLAAYEAKLKVLKDRARVIAPDAKPWRELTKEILKTENAIENINKRQRRGPSGRARLGAAGGAFLYGGGLGGGVGSAVGGIAGGLMGGVPGAFAGAAFGQAADSIGMMLASVTQGAASIAQLQRGLALASIDAKDFAEAQEAIRQSSNTLVVPIEQVYRQFTQLRVNTKQYGLSVKETQEILEGVVLAVSSTGGSLEDVDGAMRAVVQIFSKGSVQAEELRGQLGERFPGAVVKFAQANKMSFEELQSNLEQGKVTVGDFVDFAKKNYEDYAKFAEQLATAPEFAGRRLEKAMNDMQLAIGSALGPAGAIFQDFFTETIQGFTEWVNQNKEFIGQYLRDWAQLVTDFARIVGKIAKIAIDISTAIVKAFSGAIREIRRLLGLVGVAEIKAELDRVNAQIAAGGGGSRRGAAQSGLEARRQQLQAQFEAAGGQAALDSAATSKPAGLVFGGAGVGIDPYAASGGRPGGKKGRAPKELKDFAEDEVRRLREQLTKYKLLIDAQADLTASQKELNKAELEYSIGLDIVEAQYQAAIKTLSEYKEGQRATAKASMDNAAVVAREIVNAEYRKALLGDMISQSSSYEQSINALRDRIAALTADTENLSASEALEADIKRQTAGYTKDQLKITADYLAKLREQAGLIDVLTAQEKELNIEREKRLNLDRARTGLGIIGTGLRAGFTGEAANVFEQAMAQYGDLDYAKRMADLETAAMQLRSVFEGLQGAISGIGQAFGSVLTEGIASMVAGTATAKEVFASFLQSVAQALAQAASQMIATYIAIGVAKMFAGLSGGAGMFSGNASIQGGGFGSFSGGDFGIGGVGDLPGLSGAGALAGGGGIPSYAGLKFAKGGVFTNSIVSSPAFFQFADGAGFGLGMMGEAGPEAIMPLKRGPDGRLGVSVMGSDREMDRLMENRMQIMGEQAGSMRRYESEMIERLASAPAKLDINYQSQVINNVEYVTREQAERMAAQSAIRGRELALSSLQNSVKVRKRVGMS